MSNLRNKKIQDLRSLSTLLDSQFVGPLGIRFGLDGIIGLIPLVGDLVTTALSLYIVIQAAGLGCGPPVIIRMCLNILVENFIDNVPLFGHLFDFYWKSNNKNMDLLERNEFDPRGVSFGSRLVIGSILFLLLIALVTSMGITFYLIKYLIGLF